MSLGDVGDVVANLFHRTDEFLHSTLSLSAGKLSFDEICDVLTEELPVHFRSRTASVLWLGLKKGPQKTFRG